MMAVGSFLNAIGLAAAVYSDSAPLIVFAACCFVLTMTLMVISG